MKSLIMSVCFFGFGLASLFGAEISGRDIAYDALPVAKEGKFPIELPQYSGVKQLLLLNSRLIIIGTYNVPEVVDKMDELSGGKLLKAVRDWREGLAAGRKDWGAYKMPGKIHNQYLAEAREQTGERKLDAASFYKISSDEDSAYGGGKSPARVTRTFISLGGKRVDGAHNTDYGHYSFIELPEAMKNGCRYTITLGDSRKVSFLYDEMRTVSRAIKINQIGYLPDAGEKIAYLGAYAYEFGPVDFSSAKEFKVVDTASGKVVYSGQIKLREKDPHFTNKPGEDKKKPTMYGEDVYEIDLGGLKEQGEFFISIPGVGRSWTFRHADDVYGEAFYTACRGLYHQRAASALDPKYTAWPRKKSSMHDTIYECENICFPIHGGGPKKYAHFDVIGGTIDRNSKTEDVIGGWYDAADWDRNHMHFSCGNDLLNAYEAAPAKFADGQLNIPESGNGVPDILDEAVYGLECWRRSQASDGGVSGYIETWTHPGYDDPEALYAFSRCTRWNSLIYAASAAQLARLIKPFNAGLAELYAASAGKAYEFGNNPENSLGKIVINAKQKRGKGEPYTIEWEEKDEHIYPYLVHARLQMYRLTGDKSYLDGIGELAAKAHPPFQWHFSHKDFSAWIYADLALGAADVLPDELVAKWRSVYLETADQLLEHLATMPYRQTWPRYQNYWAGWGASCVTNFNRCLAIAYRLTGDKKYRDAIINNADFMLGANPMGMSWTTGMGYVYPIDIQHSNSEGDGIMDPVPGLTLYGINGGPGMHYQGRDYVWTSKNAEGEKVEFIRKANQRIPFYRCWSAHPGTNTAQCEFTVHETMASTIFTCAMLMNEGWLPNDELKNRKPRKDEYLFGYWYLP